jgi:renalase
MMKLAIIGAGMAGLACASKLKMLGYSPCLFDKGRGPSGRMSTRRIASPLGEVSFDIGAQYFTARDDDFRLAVLQWQQLGVAAPWPAVGPDAFVGTPAMNAPLKHMAAGQDIRWNARIDRMVRAPGGWQLRGEGIGPETFDTVLVALPAEQAGPLLQPHAPDMAAIAAGAPSQPCWTMMAAFDRPLPIAADIITQIGSIGWAARNSAKPGRAGPEAWVVQAAQDWSAQHLEESLETVAPALLAEFAAATGLKLPPPIVLSAHRWRYARSGNAGRGALWNAALGLGACGDWLLGPRVECAWLSGTQLAGAVAAGR